MKSPKYLKKVWSPKPYLQASKKKSKIAAPPQCDYDLFKNINISSITVQHLRVIIKTKIADMNYFGNLFP